MKKESGKEFNQRLNDQCEVLGIIEDILKDKGTHYVGEMVYATLAKIPPEKAARWAERFRKSDKHKSLEAKLRFGVKRMLIMLLMRMRDRDQVEITRDETGRLHGVKLKSTPAVPNDPMLAPIWDELWVYSTEPESRAFLESWQRGETDKVH